MYTVESKSMLAKLMASENIQVEHHSHAKTASFNMKTRVLICPIWKDMGGDLYDLLMGHEISHALRTPLEGWHDSVIYAGGNKKASAREQKAFKHFLNVIEDARIEKLVKRQYPGLRAPMFKGYKDLMARDFFGLSAISDYNKLYLIDKLNLSAKVGSLLNIKFSTKEQPFYQEMLNLETFDDVLTLARKLYQYSKEEQKEGEKEKKKLKQEIDERRQEERDQEEEDWEKGEEENEGGEGGEDEDSEDSEDGSESSESESDDEGEEDSEEGKSETDGEEGDENEETEGEEDSKDGEGSSGDEGDEDQDESESGSSSGTGTDGDLDEFIPKASTDENFRQREEGLVDNGTVRSVYMNIPTPNLNDIVTPVAIVNKGLTAHFSRGNFRRMGQQLLIDFKKKNADYVSLLAKEFEMKKAARSFSHARHAESGDININKLANYRTEDNIFKKLLIVNKGKSHGLVLLLDRSSSMERSVESATEQILIMALFCRKVNIPFTAYTFVDNNGVSLKHDFGIRSNHLQPFSTNDAEIVMMDLAFREILNSHMQASEFNNAMTNQLLLAYQLANRTHMEVPEQEQMGSTPLNEAVIVLRNLVRKFKLKHQLDIVNTIIVHDGDSDKNFAFHKGNKSALKTKIHRCGVPEEQRFDTEHDRVTITDKKENLSITCPRDKRGLQTALLLWFQKTTGCGVFGFYVTGRLEMVKDALQKMYVNKLGVPLGYINRYDRNSENMFLMNRLANELSEQKFLESYSVGYSRFYFVPGGGELAADNGEMVNTSKSGTWTPNRLLSAFKKASKKRIVSRVLVSRFIELIATH